jgi:hypothetical protein
VFEGLNVSRSVELAVSVVTFSAVALLLKAKAPLALDRAFRALESRKCWVFGVYAVLAAFGVLLLLNTAYPGYLDHAEPSIASVAWLVRIGQPLYHSFDSAARYSLLYGPSSYLIYAAALWVGGGSTLSLKVAVLCANVVMVYFLWRSYRAVLDARRALFVVALVLLFIFVPRPNHYLLQVRADVLMMCAMSIALFGVTRRSGMAGPAALAIGVAFLVDTKATACLYAIPLFATLLSQRGWKLSFAVGLSVVGLSALPFLMPNVSASQYLRWVGHASGHPSTLFDLVSTLRTLPILSAPLFLLLGPTPWRDPKIVAHVRQNRFVLLTLAVCSALAVAASSRIGAGSHHLLPFVPVVGYECARLYVATDLAFAKRSPWLFRYLCACLALVIAVRIGGGLIDIGGSWYTRWRDTRETSNEVRSLLHRFPKHDVAMGYGDTAAPVTFFRAEIVFATDRLLVDELALSDMDLDGIPLPAATTEAIATCSTHVWLIPKGKPPFTLPNTFADLYPRLVARKPLFNDAFRSAFAGHYSKKESTAHFDVWVCDNRTASVALR